MEGSLSCGIFLDLQYLSKIRNKALAKQGITGLNTNQHFEALSPLSHHGLFSANRARQQTAYHRSRQAGNRPQARQTDICALSLFFLKMFSCL